MWKKKLTFGFQLSFLTVLMSSFVISSANFFLKKLGDSSVVNFEEIFESYRTSARHNARVKYEAK
jgi:hypothetical protein